MAGGELEEPAASAVALLALVAGQDVEPARRDGYRAHVAACPETGIITGEQLTRAAGPDNSDAAATARRLAAEDSPAEVYGDSAYGTGGPARRAEGSRSHRSHQAEAAPARRGTAALNLRNLIGRGLAFDHGTWVLA